MATLRDSELTLERLEHALLAPAPHAPAAPFWYTRSREEPGWFWPFLLRQRARFAAQPPKSTFDGHIDLFNDIVVLNQDNRAPAWIAYRDKLPIPLTYPQLGEESLRVARAFRAQGVQAGQTIAVVRKVGLQLLTSVLAAWRLGAVVSVLPPEGSLHVERRLASLAPEWVDLEPFHRPLTEGIEAELLNRDGASGQSFEERSFAYPAQAPAARLFDRATADMEPVELSAQALFLGALRDGLLGLGLRPGRATAAVGLDTIQSQPSLLLATLLAGATYVHIELDQLQKEPDLLAQPLSAVGLSRSAREILLESPPSIGQSWGLWFRDPGEDSDLERWDELAAALGLQGESWAANLRWQACFGGCTVLSHRRRHAHPFVLPAPGAPWELRNLVDTEQPALGEAGYLALGAPATAGPEAELRVTRDIVAGRRSSMVYGEAAVSGHGGRGLLAEEVYLALADVLPTSPLSLAQLPLAGRLGTRCNVLLVFCGSEPPRPGLRQTIEQALDGRLGSPAHLDRIELLPLWPRRDDAGAVDHDYYAQELARGAVQRAAGDPLARALAGLRQGVETTWTTEEG